VYYLRQADPKAPYEMFRIPASGGNEEAVGLKMHDVRDLDISPDGRRLAFSVGSMDGREWWALENYLPAAR
jgi:hypothetical protein